MGKQLKDLELDLKNLGKCADPKDKFVDVMKISFFLSSVVQETIVD